MDEEPNIMASSDCTDPEIILNITDEVKEATDTTEAIDTDPIINCNNSQSLRDIINITLSHIEELADSSDLKDNRSEFLSVFGESFMSAFQENVLVNGLPFNVDSSKKLSSPEKTDHLNMVDEVLLGKLSKEVANVAHERKACPQQCCRILSIEMKHELQNLKKAKVVDSSVPSTSSRRSLRTDRTHIDKFSEFCQNFTTIENTVQCKIEEKEQMISKLCTIDQVRKKQKL